MLQRNPGFTVAVVAALALGIGVNTSNFTLFNAVALRPLPVKDPQSVVNVYQRIANEPVGYRSFSYPEYEALRDHNKVFSGLIAYSWMPFELGVGLANESAAAGIEEVHGLLVSDNYFSDLGGDALMGRTFVPEEGQSFGSHSVVVLSHSFWRRHFNSDPGLVGKVITLNGIRFTVLGIARRGFIGTEPLVPDIWVPLAMQAQLTPSDDRLHDRGSFWLEVVGRLTPDEPLQQAQAGMDLLVNQIAGTYLGTSKKVSITLAPGSFLARPDVRAQASSLAFLAAAAVGMILLIACANVANLLLARAVGRQKEVGIRLSLGASRGRLVQQLLTESILIAVLGGVMGLLLASWLPSLVLKLVQTRYEQALVLDFNPDIRILAYTLLLSLATGVIFGLAPSLQTSKPNLLSALKGDSATFGRHLSRSRLHGVLVVAQVALCLVLLIGAGLLVRGLQRAMEVNAGFDTSHVLAVSLDLGMHGYDDTRAAEFHRKFIERLQALPGVKSVSVTSLAPLGGISRGAPIAIEGREVSASGPPLEVDYWVVSPNYFETLGVPIVHGRAFRIQDTQGGQPVAIVNEAMARQFWPGEMSVGKRFRPGPESVPLVEIVGVVRNTRGARLWEADKPYMYLPLLQTTEGPPVQTGQLGMKLLVRTESNPDSVAPMLPRIVRGLDPNVQASITVLADALKGWIWFSRVGALLSGGLGFLALLLATVGIYGVTSYSVAQRTHEIGIRMALGAKQSNVLWLVLGQGMTLVALGIGLGTLASVGVSHVLSGFLYGLSPLDPFTFAAVGALFTAVAVVAIYAPARRAMKVDPMVALKYE